MTTDIEETTRAGMIARQQQQRPTAGQGITRQPTIQPPGRLPRLAASPGDEDRFRDLQATDERQQATLLDHTDKLAGLRREADSLRIAVTDTNDSLLALEARGIPAGDSFRPLVAGMVRGVYLGLASALAAVVTVLSTDPGVDWRKVVAAALGGFAVVFGARTAEGQYDDARAKKGGT